MQGSLCGGGKRPAAAAGGAGGGGAGEPAAGARAGGTTHGDRTRSSLQLLRRWASSARDDPLLGRALHVPGPATRARYSPPPRSSPRHRRLLRDQVARRTAQGHASQLTSCFLNLPFMSMKLTSEPPPLVTRVFSEVDVDSLARRMYRWKERGTTCGHDVESMLQSPDKLLELTGYLLSASVDYHAGRGECSPRLLLDYHAGRGELLPLNGSSIFHESLS